jgi:hypothetical protein
MAYVPVDRADEQGKEGNQQRQTGQDCYHVVSKNAHFESSAAASIKMHAKTMLTSIMFAISDSIHLPQLDPKLRRNAQGVGGKRSASLRSANLNDALFMIIQHIYRLN